MRAQRKTPEVAIYAVERAERLVKILGPGCATAHALTELKSRLAAGEDAVLLIAGSYICVGPRPDRPDPPVK